MIDIGVYSTLKIARHTSVGLFLADEAGEDVLLPNKYCPEEYEIGDDINVFVYLDYDERKIATNLTPKVTLGEFALLRTVEVNEIGAFLDWGLEKHLFVPFKEQYQNMEEGRSYLVYLDLDEETDRLYGTNKLDKRIQNQFLTVVVGDKVDLIVWRKTDLGYNVIINKKHKGLVYFSEVFKELKVGDKLPGYIKEIRPEHKIDVSLQPIGYKNSNDVNCELVHEALVKNEGFLPLTDKSSPTEVSQYFGISKKAFKRAIGALYKEKKITLEPNGIKLI